MGMAVAQQMVRSMNDAMAQMHVPGAINPMPTPSGLFYYAVLDGSTAGPFSEQEVSRLIAQHKVGMGTYMWRPGFTKWEKAGNVPDILRLVALIPPPYEASSLP